ncbi:MAG: hypothetical protein HYR91_09370 [Flavobacteriia bacterium]|nr:hypothetical protein [Flavobacteriia bacterium]
MKKHVVLGACIGLLISCSPKTTTSTQPVESTSKTLSAEALQGQTLYTNHCGKCHKLEPIHEFSESKWRKIVPDMCKKAKLNDEQQSLILSYVLEELK